MAVETTTTTCLVCGEPVLFERCACGGAYERALLMVTGAIMEGEAGAVLEHAARRWLEPNSTIKDQIEVQEALVEWLKERSRHVDVARGSRLDTGGVDARGGERHRGRPGGRGGVR